jgi:hypothetical protein
MLTPAKECVGRCKKNFVARCRCKRGMEGFVVRVQLSLLPPLLRAWRLRRKDDDDGFPLFLESSLDWDRRLRGLVFFHLGL